MPKEEMVRAEFIYVGSGEEKEVCIVGDWNDWSEVEMKSEGRSFRVVTSVPPGFRQFCFMVDGAIHISDVHPKLADGSCNWRNVSRPDAEMTRSRSKRDCSSPTKVGIATCRRGSLSPRRLGSYADLTLPLAATTNVPEGKVPRRPFFAWLALFVPFVMFYYIAYLFLAQGHFYNQVDM